MRRQRFEPSNSSFADLQCPHKHSQSDARVLVTHLQVCRSEGGGGGGAGGARAVLAELEVCPEGGYLECSIQRRAFSARSCGSGSNPNTQADRVRDNTTSGKQLLQLFSEQPRELSAAGVVVFTMRDEHIFLFKLVTGYPYRPRRRNVSSRLKLVPFVLSHSIGDLYCLKSRYRMHVSNCPLGNWLACALQNSFFYFVLFHFGAASTRLDTQGVNPEAVLICDVALGARRARREKMIQVLSALNLTIHGEPKEKKGYIDLDARALTVETALAKLREVRCVFHGCIRESRDLCNCDHLCILGNDENACHAISIKR